MADVAQTLISNTFSSSGFWDMTTALGTLNQDAFSTICTTAIVMGGTLWAFQWLLIFFQSGQQGTSPMPRLIASALQLALVAAVLAGGGYVYLEVLVRWGVAEPAQAVANAVTNTCIDQWQQMCQQMWSDISQSSGNPISLIGAVFSKSTMTTIVASLCYFAAAICCYVMIIIQKIVFQYMVYLGPFCLAFSLFDMTASVAKNWIGLMLTIAWFPLFCSVAMVLLTQSGGVLDSVTVAGGQAMDPISTAIYGILCIALIVGSFPLCASMFGSVGGSLTRAFNPGTTISGAVTVGAGAAAAGALQASMNGIGGAMAKAGGNSAVGRMGQGMQSAANWMSKAGTAHWGGEKAGQQMANATIRGDAFDNGKSGGSSVPKSEKT